LVGISLEDLIVNRTRSDPDILGEGCRGKAGGGDNQWLGAHQECILARLSPGLRAGYILTNSTNAPVAYRSRPGNAFRAATMRELAWACGSPKVMKTLRTSAWDKPPACQLDKPEACPTRTGNTSAGLASHKVN